MKSIPQTTKRKLFFLFFTEGIDPFLTIKSHCAVRFLIWRVMRRERTERFGHSIGEYRKFSAHLQSLGMKPYSAKTLELGIKELCEKKLIVKVKSGLYYINPKYIWLGSTDNRLKAIKKMKELEKIKEETVA